jgi:hypothetical protein
VRPSNIISNANDRDLILEFKHRYDLVRLQRDTGNLALPISEDECFAVMAEVREGQQACISESGRCEHFQGLFDCDVGICKFIFNYTLENS